MQRHQRELDLHGLARIAGNGRHAQLVHLARRDVGGDADVALAAAQHEGHGRGVVARIDGEALRRFLDEPLGPFDVARGFLDADDARHLGQAQHRVVRHIGDRAARHVVQHHRQVAGGLGDGLEVPVLALLRRLVVVGDDLQLRVGAHILGVAGQLDGFLGRVGAAAGHHGHAARRLFDRDADDLAMLLDVHGGRFARGADDAQAVRAFGNVPVDEPPQRGVVDAAVFVHRRDERDDAASQLLQGGLFVGRR